MHPGEHNHPFLVQNPVQMMSGHPPRAVQPNGNYPFHMRPVVYPQTAAVWWVIM